jgi:nitrogen fixation-related uncharacterized protein
MDRERHTYVERESSPTYIERSSSAMGIFAVLLGVVVVVFLLWAIFFSGWVVDRGGQQEAPLIEQREETEINIPGGGGTQPSPTSPTSSP